MVTKKKLTSYQVNQATKNIATVKWATHEYEFQRFYEAHQKICSNISGVLNVMLHTDDYEYRPIIINKSNFDIAIKNLEIFFHENEQYFTNKLNVRDINIKLNDLEDDYINNNEYHYLVKKVNDLNEQQKIKLESMYLKYMIECFNILEEIVIYLQPTIMINLNNISKKVRYSSEITFYRELSKYRDLMKTGLSSFQYVNMSRSIRVLLSYHYTYRFLMDTKRCTYIDELFSKLLSYMLNTKTLRRIEKLKNTNYEDLTVEQKSKIREHNKWIKKVMYKIYYLTNKALSDRDVLPRAKKKILMDRGSV